MPRFGRLRHTFTPALVITLAATMACVSAVAFGSNERASDETTTDGMSFVVLSSPASSVSTTDKFEYSVTIQVDEPTSYLESRLQIHNPSGSLFFQKTEPRNDVATGTVEISFSRDLDDLDVSPGVYPLQLRVRSDGGGSVREWVIEDNLLVFDSDAPPVKLAIVAHVAAAPSFDPEGRFVHDPGEHDIARQQVDLLTEMVRENPNLNMTLSLPPVIAEEWAHIASGYELTGPSGVTQVPADDPTPRAYADTLERLSATIATGRLELLCTPYADPDITGLLSTKRLQDLTTQFERGVSAMFSSLEASASSGTMLSEGLLPGSTIPILESRGLEYAVISTPTVAATPSPASGLYSIAGDVGSEPTMLVLLADAAAHEALIKSSPRTLLDIAFDRHLDDPTQPLVAAITVGPGQDVRVEDLEPCITQFDSAPWIETVTCGQAAEGARSNESIPLSATPTGGTNAPNGYWGQVGTARSESAAFIQAVGARDPDAQAALDDSLIAQSRAWAGPTDAWTSADRGLGFAASASRRATSILDGVSLTAQDITLPSTLGEIPLSLANASEKTLMLTIDLTPHGIALPEGSSISVTARPQDNFVTIPVDLQSSLSGTLDIRVSAGEEVLDELEVAVHATYLDRLVLVGAISLVLVGLLLFIRHRARKTDAAGTMSRNQNKE